MHFTCRISFLSVFMVFMPLLGISLVEWNNPLIDGIECPTKVLFAPALLQSEATAAYYSGLYIASTDEQIISEQPFMVMQPGHVIACNFAEIRSIKHDGHPLDETVVLSGYLPFFSYMFGLRDNIYHSIMKVDCLNADQCATGVYNHEIDFSRLNIGQESDVQILSGAYDQLDANSNIILYGFSRGSATTFIFLATEYQKEWNKRVKAAVLGGCFDSMRHVLAEQWKWMPKGKSFAQKVYDHAVKHFPSFGEKRVEPIDLAAQFPHDIPLLLVASKADSIVPYECTLALYKRLKETGHKQVYLLTLEKAWHSGHLFSNNKVDRERYLYAVHAFYKRYGLSYIAEYAEKGEQLLAQC